MTEVQSLSIIYIKDYSFAFRYVTSQIWKYYGIFGFVTNERGRIHEHKAPHRKPLKYTLLSVRDAFRISTWPLSSGLCFQVAFTVLLLAVIKNSIALLLAPPSVLGWIACILFVKVIAQADIFACVFLFFSSYSSSFIIQMLQMRKCRKSNLIRVFFYDGRKFRRKCVNVIDTTWGLIYFLTCENFGLCVQWP